MYLSLLGQIFSGRVVKKKTLRVSIKMENKDGDK